MKKYLYYTCLTISGFAAIIYSLALLIHVHIAVFLPKTLLLLFYYGIPIKAFYTGSDFVNLIGSTLFVIIAFRRIFYAIKTKSLIYPNLFGNILYIVAWLGIVSGIIAVVLMVVALNTGYFSVTMSAYPFIFSGILLYWSILIPELFELVKSFRN